jgi:hypothetical protein
VGELDDVGLHRADPPRGEGLVDQRAAPAVLWAVGGEEYGRHHDVVLEHRRELGILGGEGVELSHHLAHRHGALDHLGGERRGVAQHLVDVGEARDGIALELRHVLGRGVAQLLVDAIGTAHHLRLEVVEQPGAGRHGSHLQIG